MGRNNGIYSRKMKTDEQPFSVPTFTIPVLSLEDIDTEPQLPSKVELVEQEQAPIKVDQAPIKVEQDTHSVDKEDNKDTSTVEKIDIIKSESYAERYSFSACIIS